jgi:broad specificity phosphatase PhoE
MDEPQKSPAEVSKEFYEHLGWLRENNEQGEHPKDFLDRLSDFLEAEWQANRERKAHEQIEVVAHAAAAWVIVNT